MKQLMFQLAKEKLDEGIKENTFSEALGDVVVYVQSIDKTTGQWQNVWVSDMRDQQIPSITMAKSGSMVGDSRKMQVTIILENGSLNRPNGTHAQTVTFERYQINIPLHIPSVIIGKDINYQSTNSMTMGQLQLAATQLGRESKQGRKALVQYHRRLVLPVGCFILSLLGLPLGLQARAGKSAIGIPLGLGFFILYYVLFTVGKNMAEEGPISVLIAMWLPNIIFFTFTLILLRQTANERPLIPATICNGCSALIARWFSPLMAKLCVWTHLPVKKLIKRPNLNMRQYEQTPDEPLGPGHLTTGTVHGNMNSMTCHVPGCESYSCRHCTIEFKNMEIALQAGFTPCNNCKAILEKQSSLAADMPLP
jgi:lipopolysaccharide export system permease protein